MIRVTPVLRSLIGSTQTRSADDTVLYKALPSGFVALVGAGSPDNLARRPIRIVLADELDKYPVTREGDPIVLADERTATFANWLIEDSYEASDQSRASIARPLDGAAMRKAGASTTAQSMASSPTPSSRAA